MKRLLAGMVLVVAALPALGGRLPNDPRGTARRDAVAPGSLAGLVRPAPEAGDPRVWYFVVVEGKDPDFNGLGARVEASWKNRRLVRIPPQAVQGLARHPDVQYLQRIDEPGTQGSRGAVAELSDGPESGSGEPAGNAELGTLTWTSGTYGYDGAGNIVSIGPDHYGRVQNYNYDGLGRLTTGTAHTSSGMHLESYGYDVYGNLVEKSTDGAGGPPLSVNPATNQLQTATYDVAGNMASYGSDEFFWDAGGMLKEMWYGAGGQKGYVYTPDDERLGVVTNGANYWTWTVRDLSGKVIREYESAAGEFQYAPWLWVEDYAHGLGRLLVSEREGAEGGRRHYHADHLGSTRFVTTEDGVPGVTAGDGYRATEHVYYPFGLDATELRQEHGLGFRRETRLKYTGHERDYMAGEFAENTNYLDYMHARYYNPNLGRFLSIDPGTDWNPSQPQSWNLYTYVRNNPTNAADPTGRCAQDLNDPNPCSDMAITIETTAASGTDYALETAAETLDQTAFDLLNTTGFPKVIDGMLQDDPGKIALGYGQQLALVGPGAIASGLRPLAGAASGLLPVAETAPELAYTTRVLERAVSAGADDMGHNFPRLLDSIITRTGQIQAKSVTYLEYSLSGHINGSAGVYQIGGRLTKGVLNITHRAFIGY